MFEHKYFLKFTLQERKFNSFNVVVCIASL